MESEDVAQDEDGELARRQDLKGGHKIQGDGFGLLVAGLWVPSGTSITPSRRASGNGSSHTTLLSRDGSGGSTPGTSHSLAGRRLADRRALRHWLVAIR